MTDDKNLLDKIAEDLADGKVVDWEQSKLSHSKKRRLIDQLNAIAKISEAYENNSHGEINRTLLKKDPVIFEWGHLQVLGKIGEGSYGEVYRAYDSVLDREVALKLLKQDKLAPIQSRAFIQEARRLAKVRNHHVLAIHGANVHDSRVGIWSDLIVGANLAEKQSKEPEANHNYSINQLLPLMNALADALIAVHDAGLIHGDIKPSNVMIDSHNKFTLMDFGAGTEFNSDNSQSGYLIGTLLYMAPELFEKNTLSSASDIYAFGVLLFNLAAGDYPFTGKDLAAIKQAHIDTKAVSLDRLRSDLPKSIRYLIQQMMLVDPKLRPTAIQIKEKLNWISTAPQRRNKRLAISLIVGLSVLGTLISSVGFYRANQAQQVAVQEKEKAEAFSEFMKDTLKAPASLGKGKEVRVADLLATAAEEAAVKFVDQPHSKAAIFHAIGDSYNSLKLPEDALKHLSESYATLKKIHGTRSPETLGVLLEVAESHHVVGDDVEAKKLYLQAIEIAQLHDMPSESIFAQIKLADLIRIEGDYAESESMLKKLIPQIPDENSHKNLNKFLALTVLSQNYLRRSNYPLAESTAKEALQWLEIYQPDDDIRRNEVLNIVARTLIWQRKLSEAETITRELVILVQLLYGQTNYEYLRANTLLSTTLFEQGKLDEALAIQEHLLALTDQVQGDTSLYRVIISNNLANTMIQMSDYVGAEQLLQDALNLAHGFLDADNVQILTLELNLVGLVNIMGRYQEAEEMAQATHLKMIQKLGDQHMFTFSILDQLAMSFAGQQRYVESAALHQSLIQQLIEIKAGETSQMITVLEHFIDTLISSEQVSQAKDNLLILIPLQQQILGESHPDTVVSMQKLNDL